MPLPLPPRPPAREDPPTAPWTSPSASSPTGSLNHIPILLGIPTDSTSSETALAAARDGAECHGRPDAAHTRLARARRCRSRRGRDTVQVARVELAGNPHSRVTRRVPG